MQLAQTGSYKGAAGIEEYVRFASPSSPFLSALASYDKDAQVKTASDPETGECVMTVGVTSAAKFTDLLDVDRAVSRLALLKVFFEPTSYNSIAISKIYVHYPEAYLRWFFGNLTNTDQTREYVCNVMKNSCPETWDLNMLDFLGACTDRLKALDAFGDSVAVSGDTQGCRVLHSVFAETNPSHCAHLSFVPQADPNGLYKCQQSRFRPTSEMFDVDDLQVFEDKKVAMQLDNDMAAVVCDCSAETSLAEDDKSWLSTIGGALNGGFGWLINGLASFGPLPDTWVVGTIPFCGICNDEEE